MHRRTEKIDGYAIERIVVRYLKQHKWSILEQNFQIKFGEIDIIAQDVEKVIVAIEVKSMKTNQHFKPEHHFNSIKSQKVQRVFQHYIVQHNLCDADCRIDLVAVDVNPLTHKAHIRHYKNVGV